MKALILQNLRTKHPSLYNAYRTLKMNLKSKISLNDKNDLSHLRIDFFKRIKSLSSFVKTHKFSAGYFDSEGSFFLKTIDDLYLYYNFDDYRYILGDGQSLDLYLNQEPTPLEELILSSCQNGMTYFDVGSNNGYFYCLKIAAKFPNSQVFAFEPDPSIYLHLQANIKINKTTNITINPIALSHFLGISKMSKYMGASGYLVTNPSDQLETIDVKVTTLDAFVLEQGIKKIDLIKIDIEGGEVNFLKGALKSLAEFKPLGVMEINESLLKRSGSSLEEVLKTLKSLGYSLYRVESSHDVLLCQPSHTKDLAIDQRSWLKPY